MGKINQDFSSESKENSVSNFSSRWNKLFSLVFVLGIVLILGWAVAETVLWFINLFLPDYIND